MRFVIGTCLLILTASSALADCDQGAHGAAKSAITAHWKKLMRFELLTCVFYGDYSGDRKKDALAFFYYANPDGGNMSHLAVAKFRSSKNGFRFDGSAEIYGDDPRDVRFTRGKITVVTTTEGPNDSRCCPTLPKRWSIPAR